MLKILAPKKFPKNAGGLASNLINTVGIKEKVRQGPQPKMIGHLSLTSGLLEKSLKRIFIKTQIQARQEIAIAISPPLNAD